MALALLLSPSLVTYVAATYTEIATGNIQAETLRGGMQSLGSAFFTVVSAAAAGR